MRVRSHTSARFGPIGRKTAAALPRAALAVVTRTKRDFLLPNLLPNAVGRAGKKTDEEHSDVQNVPTSQGDEGWTETGRDGSKRIRKPLLYPTELRDRSPRCFGTFSA